MTPPEPINDGAPELDQDERVTTSGPMVVHCQADGVLTFVNDAYCRVMGLSPPALLGRSFWAFLPPREGLRGKRHVAALTPGAPVAVIEYLLDGRPDRFHRQRWTDHARFDGHGHLIEWLAVGEDMPAESRAWQREEILTAAMLAALSDTFALFSNQGDYLHCHVRSTGKRPLPPDSVVGRNIRDILPPELAARMQAAFDLSLATGEVGTLEYTLVDEGEERVYEMRIAGYTPQLLIALIRDRTEERQQAHALARAEAEARSLQEEIALLGKVASLGVLTSAIAHELNQPLMSTATNVQAALKFLTAPTPNLDEARAALSDIGQSNRRVSEIVGHLFASLKAHAIAHVPVDLNAIAADVIRLVRRQTRSRGVIIETHLAPDLPLVSGDRIQLQQVVLNLLLNACEAFNDTPSDSRVVIRTGRQENGVVLSVIDSGVGIPEGEVARAFEPFYTTKAHGTGLGLAISRTILTLHRGRLGATRNPEGGMTFSFTLPASPAGNKAKASGRGA